MKLESRVHKRLSAGQSSYGGWFGLNSPSSIEFLANDVDLDFICVEQQHSAIGQADSIHLLRAMQAANPKTTPFIRLATQDKYGIEQSLDAGYVGLIVPLVESAEEAEALVRASYYPPLGARSQAGSIRARLYEDYFTSINDHLILLPQIESRVGLEHCEDIVGVSGVSGLLFGPTDLSLSCGWTGKDLWSHQPFLDAVDRVIEACRSAGKIAATLTGGLEGTQRVQDSGFNLISFIHEGVQIRVKMVEDAQKILSEMRREEA